MFADRDQEAEDGSQRVLAWGSLACAPLLIIFAGLQWLHYGLPLAGLLLGAAAVLVALAPLLHRRGIPVGAYISGVLFTAITGVSYLRGGVVVPILAFDIPLIVVPLILGLPRAAWISAGITAGQLIFLWTLEHVGLTSARIEATSSGAIVGFIGIFIALATSMIVLERLRRGALDDQAVLRAQLLRANRLEAMARLSGGVAHDFNNLLAVIGSRATIVREHLADDDEIQADVIAIQKAVRAGADLTQRLLAIGREDTVTTTLAVDASSVVADVAALLRGALPDNVVVELDDTAEPVIVDGDPRRLHQVVMNLAINARDAMPTGGLLRLATATTRLASPIRTRWGAVAAGTWASIRVVDSGEGMQEEVLDRILEPFFTTKGEQGTGLGLAVVDGIVRGMGGHVDIRSTVGKGTEIHILLPLSEAREADDRMSVPERMLRESKPARVLLVEDDRAVRAATRRLLGLDGHMVTAAESGATALEALERHEGNFDVLLTDLNMPGMSGKVLAEEVRALYPDIGIIFLSGYAGDSLSAKERDDERVRFLQKPATRDAIKRTIDELHGA